MDSKLQRVGSQPARAGRGKALVLDLSAVGDQGAIGFQQVVFTRGRERFFLTKLEPELPLSQQPVRLDIPADTVQGLYSMVLQRDDGSKVVERNAVMVLDDEHHDGRFPMLDAYRKWHYVLNSEGIPMKDMGTTIGFVEHPLVVYYFASTYLSEYLRDRTDEAMLAGCHRLAEWFLKHFSEGTDGALLFRHDFPLQSWNLESGWISGLTQGRIAEFFLDYADIFERSDCLEIAERCVRVLAQPLDAGGLLVEDALGNLSIEEFPTSPPCWSINGIGSAISSLERVAKRHDAPWITPLIDRVCASVESKIDLFDCPDVPGSRVQLALKYLVRVEWEPAEPSRWEKLKARFRPAAAEASSSPWILSSIELQPPLSPAYEHDVPASLVPARMNRSRWESMPEGVAVQEGSLWLELFLDGNEDCSDLSRSAATQVTLTRMGSDSGVFRLFVVVNEVEHLLVSVPFDRRQTRASARTRVAEQLPQGVGRIARFDEYYHETNLNWMWYLSRFGRLGRTWHAGVRWLLSFHGGGGRVDTTLTQEVRSRLESDLAVRQKELATLSKRPGSVQLMHIQSLVNALEYLLVEPERRPTRFIAVSPQIQEVADQTECRVYGTGFRRAEAFRIRLSESGEDATDWFAITVVSDDELKVQLSSFDASQGVLATTGFVVVAERADAAPHEVAAGLPDFAEAVSFQLVAPTTQR